MIFILNVCLRNFIQPQNCEIINSSAGGIYILLYYNIGPHSLSTNHNWFEAASLPSIHISVIHVKSPTLVISVLAVPRQLTLSVRLLVCWAPLL